MNVSGASNPVYAPCYRLNQTTGKVESGTYNCSAFLEKVQKQIEEAKTNPPEVGNQTLSDAEIKELADKYDPNNMSQTQYDSFIRYLQEKGVLSRLETSDLGMSCVRIVPGYFEPAYTSSTLSGRDVFVHTLDDVHGDAIRFAQIMSQWQSCGDYHIKENAYQKVLGILNQMNAAREQG